MFTFPCIKENGNLFKSMNYSLGSIGTRTQSSSLSQKRLYLPDLLEAVKYFRKPAWLWQVCCLSLAAPHITAYTHKVCLSKFYSSQLILIYNWQTPILKGNKYLWSVDFEAYYAYIPVNHLLCSVFFFYVRMLSLKLWWLGAFCHH